MGMHYGPETGYAECSDFVLERPFEYLMSDGVFFRIDHVTTIYPRTLHRQLSEQKRVEVKFCVRDDEELDGTDSTEQWELVFFPMYRKGEEIIHDTIVPHDDSVVNGNLVIENGKVVNCSSNYHSLGYEEMQDPVVEFAKKHIECLLAK